MSKASTMFNKLGFKLYGESANEVSYKFETDYVEIFVHFDIEPKTYYIYHSSFIDNDGPMFVPMDKRPENIKHSARYGHWQAEMTFDIDIRLHNAIHQQMIELGWIE